MSSCYNPFHNGLSPSFSQIRIGRHRRFRNILQSTSRKRSRFGQHPSHAGGVPAQLQCQCNDSWSYYSVRFASFHSRSIPLTRIPVTRIPAMPCPMVLPEHLVLGKISQRATGLINPDMHSRDHRHPRNFALGKAQPPIALRGR